MLRELKEFTGKKLNVTRRTMFQQIEYVNKEGRTVYTTDVVATRVEFIGGGGGAQGGQGQYSQGSYQGRGGMDQGGYNQGGYQPQAQPVREDAAVSRPQDDDIPEGFETIDEDDIPF